MIQLEDDGTFSVPSETKRDVIYSVSMELRTCSCPHGRLKGPCKHRSVVSLTQKLPSFDLVPEENPQMRKMWMYIGTGKDVELDYFLPLSDPKNPNQTAPNNVDQIWNMTVDNSAEVLNVEEMDIDHQHVEENHEDHQDETEEVEKKLEDVFSKLRNIISDRIKHDPKGYKKSLRTFEKHLDRMPKMKDAALQKALCTFGQESFAPLSKRKNGHLIPVQVYIT